MSFSQPWLLTPLQFAETALFHGSCEPWQNPVPRPGGYDKVFWTAEQPLIAQIYIPNWYSTISFTISSHQLDSPVPPDEQSFAWDVAQQLGATATVHKKDHIGRAQSWSSGKKVTFQEVKSYLEGLGYIGDGYGNENFRVKTSFQQMPDGSRRYIAVPAAATPYGRLVMIPRPEEAASHDFSTGEDPDLTNPQYHLVDAFREAFQGDKKAVRIHDFCQSPIMGNVGHASIGFSASTMKALHEAGAVRIIAATQRDFSKEWPRTAEQYLTEDLLQWHFSETVRAIALGHEVPAEVIAVHQERFDQAIAGLPGDAPIMVATTLDSLALGEVSAPAEAPDPARVETLVWGLEVGNLEHNSTFVLDAAGRLHCTQGIELLEAVRQKGYCVPVQTQLTDQDGRVVTCEAIAEVICATQMPYSYEISTP
ncbi:TPA: hypothetical protein ACGJRU_003091 [Pseudomonas aeruginosa]|uniref:hypothetical protein n=1 Tax=Pseudomonas aeruginosa TaxID=287 RepID=UPI00053E6033|nr:hypothetical protein [Pseudomonas aeruginosa]